MKCKQDGQYTDTVSGRCKPYFNSILILLEEHRLTYSIKLISNMSMKMNSNYKNQEKLMPSRKSGELRMMPATHTMTKIMGTTNSIKMESL